MEDFKKYVDTYEPSKSIQNPDKPATTQPQEYYNDPEFIKTLFQDFQKSQSNGSQKEKDLKDDQKNNQYNSSQSRREYNPNSIEASKSFSSNGNGSNANMSQQQNILAQSMMGFNKNIPPISANLLNQQNSQHFINNSMNQNHYLRTDDKDKDRDRERDRDRDRDRDRRHHDSNNFDRNRSSNNPSSDDWSYRNGKQGIKSFMLNEDDQYFREHAEQMRKKLAFDFKNLKTLELKVFFQNRELTLDKQYESFKELKINPKLIKNLDRMLFDTMTPIQKYVTPFILEGNDVMGCSATGSGKTIAFLLPIAEKMLKEGPPDDSSIKRGVSAPVALILIPTRELAEQIYVQARKLLHQTGINVVKVYGGVPHETQIRDFKLGCDILVSTPGRLLDYLKSGLVTLAQVKYFIIDEADRILDMGFEPQLNSITFENDLREKRKRLNLFFSATFTPEVRNIARKFMNEYYFVTKNKDEENHVNENIKMVLVQADENEKLIKLHGILQQIKGSVIIFVETKKGVDNLHYQLIKAKYNVIAIHGNKTQIKRTEAIKKFSDGHIPILIATDVASRGLDFPSVSYVFNFDMPTNIDDYIHRIGRTGRCGNKGVSISFINDRNRPIIKDLFHILEKYKQEIPDWFNILYRRFKDEKFDQNMMKQRYRQNQNNSFSGKSYGGGFGNSFGKRPDGFQSAYSYKPPSGSFDPNPPYFNNNSYGGLVSKVNDIPVESFNKFSSGGFERNNSSGSLQKPYNDRYNKKPRSKSASKERDRKERKRSRSKSDSRSRSRIKTRSRSRSRQRSRSNRSKSLSKERSRKDNRNRSRSPKKDRERSNERNGKDMYYRDSKYTRKDSREKRDYDRDNRDRNSKGFDRSSNYKSSSSTYDRR